MRKIALIKDGVVENIAVWDGVQPWDPPEFTKVDITARVGSNGKAIEKQDLYSHLGDSFTSTLKDQPVEKSDVIIDEQVEETPK